MKILKKVFLALTCAAVFSGAVFAQTSQTSDCTSELFDTDIDNFMSVTGWSTVQPDNLFLMADFDGIGAAKQFNNFYVGSYFGGVFGYLSSSSISEVSSSPEKTEYTFNRSNLGLLFGFSNMAVKAYYSPKGTSYSTEGKSSTSVVSADVTKSNDYAFTTGLQYGICMNLLDKPFNQAVAIEYSPEIKHEYKYTAATETEVETTTETLDSMHALNVISNSSWQIFSGENFTNTAELDFSASFGIIPKTKTSYEITNTGAYENNFHLTPAWITKYENDRFKFGIKGSLPMQFFKEADSNYTTTNGVKEYTGTRTSYTLFSIVPQIDLGAQFQIANSVTFNAGISLDLPVFLWSINRTESRNTTDGSVYSDIIEKTSKLTQTERLLPSSLFLDSLSILDNTLLLTQTITS